MTTQQALEVLRADHNRRVEEIANGLRPMFEKGMVRGYTGEDA
jgi:hypothetical protein